MTTHTTEEAQEAIKSVIQYCGHDHTREGLKETPERYIKFLDQFMKPAEFELTSFTDAKADEMVVVKDIPFYSLCEHHLAPFFGVGHIAYIPNGTIVGISKLPRTLLKFASNFQNQERITQQVAEYIMSSKLSPKGVAVVLEARHLCMEMRGVKARGASTVTSSMLGAFKEDAKCRNEFLTFIK